MEPSSNLHLIWDDTELDDIYDDIMEEACVGNDYNLQSMGTPKSNDSSSTFKTIAKKTTLAATSTKISIEKDKYIRKD